VKQPIATAIAGRLPKQAFAAILANYWRRDLLPIISPRGCVRVMGYWHE
jgi:hypothetical protein